METLIIKNFDQFLDALNLCDVGVYRYEEVIKSARIEPDDLNEFINWEANGISVASVLKKDHFEVFVYGWKPGQQTEILETKGSGWLRVVSGRMNVMDYVKTDGAGEPKLASKHLVNEQECVFLPPMYQLINAADEPCVGIQLQVH